MQDNNAITGLYVHIPFCSALCHYCDFSKTARHDDDLVARYLEALRVEIETWKDCRELDLGSVFFGGGTPGLFASEYQSIFDAIEPYLEPDCEISIEANPSNCTKDNLSVWRELGFNRLSIGVQSFAEQGLASLTRDHSSREAMDAIANAREFFPNFNIDLIYAWEAQSLGDWESDLDTALSLDAPHLSLYGLIYEPGTPFGRQASRGKRTPADGDLYARMYELARQKLDGYGHEEVSNWAKPGHSCRHNWLYWNQDYYIGIGSGAHGYLPSRHPFGTRYSWDKIPTNYLRRKSCAIETPGAEAWLLEYIGSALRTSTGIDLDRIATQTGWQLVPNPVVQRALDEKMMSIHNNRRLILSPAEWYRETAWAAHLANSVTLSPR